MTKRPKTIKPPYVVNSDGTVSEPKKRSEVMPAWWWLWILPLGTFVALWLTAMGYLG